MARPLRLEFSGALYRETLREVLKAHRRSVALTLAAHQEHYLDENEMMAQACLSGAYTMVQIGQHSGMHYMTVSLTVRQFEGKRKEIL